MRKLLIIASLFLLVSCDNKEKSNIPIININNAISVNHHPLMEAVESIEFIPLETNKENLMGYINRVSLKNNRIYIFDHLSYKIHIFNSEGEWLSTLNKKGKGPDEYLYIKDFFVGEDGVLYIMTFGKILMYDKKLNYIGKIKTPDINNHIRNFYLFDKDNIIFYNTFDKKGNNNLLLHFKNNKIIDSYGQIKEKDNFGLKRFLKYNDKINLIPPFYSNEILSVDENFNISKRYIIKLDYESFNNNSNRKLKKPTGGEKYLIKSFLETDKFIYLTYNGNPIRHCLYNKYTGRSYKSEKSYTKEKGGFILNAYNVDADNKYLLGIISSIRLIKYSKELKPDNTISEKQLKIIKGLKDTYNPVVIKITLK